MENEFTHSGDLGDIIYGLPVIRALGGGTLRVRHTPGKTAHGMTAAKVARLRPLLMAQDYITDVVWDPDAPPTNLDGFRDHWRAGNLADMHLCTHDIPWTARTTPWLHVADPIFAHPIIVHRSARYHGVFPWAAVVARYGPGDQIGFVGMADEHVEFCNEFGPVPFVPAQDFLTLARVIAGSQWFFGNQSAPLAVAHGMKHNVLMEICHHAGARQHCVYQRPGCVIVWDEKAEFPEIL
jgi:hypothetical protein